MGFVQGTGDELTGTGYSLAVAFTSDVTAGNLIVVAFSEYNVAPTLSNISDSRGNTWTLNAQASEAAGDGTIFTCIAQDSGPMTITVTYGSPQYMAMAIAEFSGYTQTEIDEATATVTGTNIHAGSVTGAGLYIGMHEQTSTDTTITPDGNWDGTVYNNNGGTNYPSIVLSYREVSAGTYDDGWSLAASRNCGVIGIIFEAKAVYNLGYTSIGATNGGSERPYANVGGSYLSDVAAITGEVLSFFIYLNANVLGSNTVEIGVYNDSGAGDTPGDLLGTANGYGSGVAHWEEFDVSAQHIQLTQGQKYYVAAHIGGSTSNRWTYQSTLTGAKIRYVTGLTALPDPWPADATSSSVMISMYLRYAAGSGIRAKSAGGLTVMLKQFGT